jgi:hypothetical protein
MEIKINEEIFLKTFIPCREELNPWLGCHPMYLEFQKTILPDTKCA